MAKKQKTTGGDGDLFIEGSGQLRLVDKSAEQQALEKGKVEYLGMTFDSEDSRRAYFTDRLREKLADPEFRNTPGFPKGTDNDIIRLRYTVSFGLDSLDAGSGGLGLAGVGWEEAEQGRSSDSMR